MGVLCITWDAAHFLIAKLFWGRFPCIHIYFHEMQHICVSMRGEEQVDAKSVRCGVMTVTVG